MRNIGNVEKITMIEFREQNDNLKIVIVHKCKSDYSNMT